MARKPKPRSTSSEISRTAAHKKLRAKLAPIVAAGGVRCAAPFCGELILPGELWDLGHDDNHPGRYSGPEHRRCNRATVHRANGGRPPRELSSAEKVRRHIWSREW
jgi:hypothetical protein